MPANLKRIMQEDTNSEIIRTLLAEYADLRASKLQILVGANPAAAGADRRPLLAANDSISEYAVLQVTEVTGIHVDDIQFQVASALTSNDTNYVTFTFKKRTAAGADGGTVAVFTTETSGSGGTGNLTAFVPISLRSSAVGTGGTQLAAPLLLEQGESLTMQAAQAASGVVVTGGVFTIHTRTKADEILLNRPIPRRPSVTAPLDVPT